MNAEFRQGMIKASDSGSIIFTVMKLWRDFSVKRMRLKIYYLEGT